MKGQRQCDLLKKDILSWYATIQGLHFKRAWEHDRPAKKSHMLLYAHEHNKVQAESVNKLILCSKAPPEPFAR